MSELLPIGISARHLHLSQQDVERLFGPGHTLTPQKQLTQPGQFSCLETVAVYGPKGSFAKVRVLGPARRQTQVEVSRSDAFILGLDPPVRDSGDLAGSPGARLVGPAGEVELHEGVIVAHRHLHLESSQAAKLGLKDREFIRVRVSGPRAVLFERVLVRVSPDFDMDLHLDTDEANAAGVKNGDHAELVP
ncbi:MAG: phosphate propanoyltransferase [Bacteroidota bacterium]